MNCCIKGTWLAAAAVAGVLSVGAAVMARPSTPNAVTSTVEVRDELGKQMEILQGNFRKLKKSLGDAKMNADSLAAIGKMQGAAMAAKGMEPHVEGEMAADKKTEYMNGYKTRMIKLAIALLELEAKVIEGKNDDAVKQLGDIDGMMKEGHKIYKK